MRMSRLALLALPLTFAAIAAPLDAFNGTFDLSGETRGCPAQLRMNSRGNDVFLVDGQSRVVDQLTIGEVRMGRNKLKIGALRAGVITVTEYSTGMLGRRTELSSRSLTLRGNQLSFVEANQGACTYLKVIPRPQGAVGDLPALDRPARTRIVSLDESFRSAEELFEVGNAEQIIAAVNLIKSATPEYHNELKNMIVRLEAISLDQVKLLFKLMYFTPRDQLALTTRLRELEAADAYSDDRGSEYQVVLRNLNLANDFASQMSMSFYAIKNKLPKLSGANFISLARELPRDLGHVLDEDSGRWRIADSALDGSMIHELLGHLATDISLVEKRTVLTFLRAQRPGYGVDLAVDIFRAEHSSYDAQTLLTGTAALYPEKQLDLVVRLVARADLDAAGARRLIAFVGDNSAGISAVLSGANGKVVWEAAEIRSFAQKGISIPKFKELGFTAATLKDAGFGIDDLNDYQEYTSAELKAAFGLAEFKAAGYTVQILKQMGYTAVQMKAVGFSIDDMNDYQEYTSDELKAVFGLAEFKVADYTVQILKQMGYTAVQMKAVGFSIDDMNDYQEYTNDELKAVFGLAEFKAAGYTVMILKQMGYTAGQMMAVGFSIDDMNDYQEYSSAELKEVFGLAEFKAANYTVQTLKQMGYTAVQMKAVGFSIDDLNDYQEYSSVELRTAFTIQDFIAAGNTARTLKGLGFTVLELRAAGFNDVDLFQAGFTRPELGLN